MISFGTRESERFANLNYANPIPLSILLDVAHYYAPNNEERYFMTADGRFAVAWQLSPIPGETITPGEKRAYSDAFAHALNKFPEGSCGQILRYHHDDIRPWLRAFAAEISDAPFSKELIESIVQRQIHGAHDGFYANVSTSMLDKARDSALASIEESEQREQASYRIEASMREGRYAHVSDLYLTFSYEPYWVRSGVMVDKLIDRVMGRVERYQEQFRKELRAFMRHVEEIQNVLVRYHFNPQIVSGQGLVDVLFRELNPSRTYRSAPPVFRSDRSVREIIDQAHQKPSTKSIPDSVQFTPVQLRRSGWKIAETYYEAVSLRDLPSTVHPGKLNEVLDQIEATNWCAINFSVPSQGAIRFQLALKEQNLRAKSSIRLPLVSPDPVLLAKQLSDVAVVKNALNPEERNRHLALNTSVHIAIKGKNEKETSRKADEAEVPLFALGYHEKMRGDAMIHSMLPFNYRASSDVMLQRSKPYLSYNLSDLAPIFRAYGGIEYNKYALLMNNSRGEPIFVSQFGPHTTAGHSLVVGSTGSGKSFLVNNLMMQMRARYRPKQFIIDKGASYREFCEANGGSYITLAVEEEDGVAPVCINPFYVSPDEKGRARQPRVSEIFFMHRVVMMMVLSGTGEGTGINAGLEKEDSTLLLKVLRNMFRKAQPAKELTLSDYVRALGEDGQRGKELAAKLFEYTKEGIYGALFDGPSEVNWDADVIVIETDKLDGTPAMSIVMMVLFYMIDLYCKYRLPRDRAKSIVIDEAWAALSDPTGAIPRIIGGYFREMRKYLCAVTLISQDLATFINIASSGGKGGAAAGIMGNTRHFFLLSCSRDDLKNGKEHLGLTDAEVAAWQSVSSLPPFFSECFYRLINKQDKSYSGKFRLVSNPVALWLATTNPHDVNMKRPLIAKYVKAGADRIEATRRAVVELAQEYPYGSEYIVNKAA